LDFTAASLHLCFERYFNTNSFFPFIFSFYSLFFPGLKTFLHGPLYAFSALVPTATTVQLLHRPPFLGPPVPKLFFSWGRCMSKRDFLLLFLSPFFFFEAVSKLSPTETQFLSFPAPSGFTPA